MAQNAPSAAITVKPPTRFQAQRNLGLFAPLDFTVAALILASWITMGFWKLFGNPDVLRFILAALVNIFLMQCWLTVLAYRCLVFVLDLHADVALMPEAAARIVSGFMKIPSGK